MSTIRCNLASECMHQLAPSNITVTFDPPPELAEFYGKHAFPMTPGETCLYLGEVKNMPGHGMFLHTSSKRSGQSINIWHIDNFWYVVENVAVVESRDVYDERVQVFSVSGCVDVSGT